MNRSFDEVRSMISQSRQSVSNERTNETIQAYINRHIISDKDCFTRINNCGKYRSKELAWLQLKGEGIETI